MSASAHALMILTWHGHTSWLESLYIFPGYVFLPHVVRATIGNRANKKAHSSGFGTAVTMNALFTAIQVSVDRAHIAPAVSMVFLASGLGTVLGLAASSAVYQAGLRSTLESRLVYLHLDADLRDQVSHSSALLSFKPPTSCAAVVPMNPVSWSCRTRELTTPHFTDHSKCGVKRGLYSQRQR